MAPPTEVHKQILIFRAGKYIPKISMDMQTGGLEDDFPFQYGDFYVPC